MFIICMIYLTSKMTISLTEKNFDKIVLNQKNLYVKKILIFFLAFLKQISKCIIKTNYHC